MFLKSFRKLLTTLALKMRFEQQQSHSPLYYQWENVLNVKTRLLKIDAVNEPLPEGISNDNGIVVNRRNRKRLVVIIPGNPGIIQFYEEFALALWRNLGCTTAVWGVSYAGHVFHEDLSKERYVVDQPAGHLVTEKFGDTYASLQFQIRHKQAFLEHHVPADIDEIILVAHSMGSYTSLQILKRMATNSRIVHIIGLFPTIERMAVAPQGRMFSHVGQYGTYLLLALGSLLSWLPEGIKRRVVRLVAPSMTGHLHEAMMNMSHYPVFKNWFLMGADQMFEVLESDDSLLNRPDTRVTLYYGREDSWVPVDYYTRVAEKFPDGDFHLCDKGYRHAFVIRHALPMAELVASWIDGGSKRPSTLIVN